MNTIKLFLSTAGRTARCDKNFPLYCGQFQNVLLNIFVPTAILSADFEIQHFIGNDKSALLVTDPDLQTRLNNFVLTNTRTYINGEWQYRSAEEGDVIFYTCTENGKFYRATFNGTLWGFVEVPYFAMGDIAGTNVKVGVIATEPNGTQYKSKSYYCRYVKKLTSSADGVEYALYERKMPREFTAFIGSGQAARTAVINVTNTNDNKVETIVTSQTVALDVLPSTQLDGDEPIEATAEEELWSAVNDIVQELSEKQDKRPVHEVNGSEVSDLNTESDTVVGAINELESGKQDKVDSTIDYKDIHTVVGAINKLGHDKQESTDNSLLTENKTIVGAINEVDSHADAANAQAAENKEDISGLKTRMTAVEGVADAANERSIGNATDIAALQAIVGTGEDFIGTLTVDHEVTNAELTTFVTTTAGRAPKGGDSVIVIQQVAGGTDKTFKYIYNGTIWEGYEIPAVELASNGTAGLVSGTYAVDATANTIVNIVGGEIQNIYVKDGATYRDIRDFLLANKLSISNIVDGTTVVKEAETATKDSEGNNIANAFAALVSGATKVGAAVNADAAEVATKDSAGNNIATQFSNIVGGTTQVGSAAYAAAALKATQDALGNNIVDTYLTQAAGATKNYVKNYALPKEFNNCLYLSANGYSEQIPSTPASGVQFTVNTTTIGEVLVGSCEYTLGDLKFQLSRKNSYSARFFIEYDIAGISDIADLYHYKLVTYAQKAGQSRVLLCSDLLPDAPLSGNTYGQLVAVDFGASFAALDNTVLNLETGDKIIQELYFWQDASRDTTVTVYSSGVYPSRLNLNTGTQTLIYRESAVGEAIYAVLSLDNLTVDNGYAIFATDNAELVHAVENDKNVNVTLVFPDMTGVAGVTQDTQLAIEVNEAIYYLSSAQNGAPPISDFLPLKRAPYGDYMMWGTVIVNENLVAIDIPRIPQIVRL